jgi:hypothetical protein
VVGLGWRTALNLQVLYSAQDESSQIVMDGTTNRSNPQTKTPVSATTFIRSSQYILIQNGTNELCLAAQDQASSGPYIANSSIREPI